MEFFTLDPLSDSRWDELAARHPRSSVFHQSGWLKALATVYGYTPLALTTSPAGEPLRDGLALCRVSSWITGTRLVSLPFSDHCDALADDVPLADYMDWLRAECDRHHYDYVELRPLSERTDQTLPWPQGSSYYIHFLDLTGTEEEIFRGLHKDSMQRRIRRAEREHLSYEAGRSDQLVEEFCRLQLMTRRRHHLFPQPAAWFRGLVRWMGDRLHIHVARKDGAPVAAMLTLRHRASVVYKYGCSDARFHYLGGMPLLFWRLIEESRAAGAEQIDLGRSDPDQAGLITFKDRLGASKRLLRYLRYSPAGRTDAVSRWGANGIRRILPRLPELVLRSAGHVLYRHLG